MKKAAEWNPPKPHKPHAKQIAFFLDKRKRICLPCGRGSGKTATALRKLVLCAIGDHVHDMNRYAYMGPTRDQAKQTAWEAIKALVPPWLIIGDIKESELTIEIRCNLIDEAGNLTGKTGKSIIQIIGLDRPKRAEGRHDWEGIIIDECCDIKPGTFELSIQPSLMHRGTWVVFAGVPKRTGCGAAWYKKLCQQGMLNPGEDGYDPNLITYSWPSSEIVPAEYLEEVKRSPNYDIKNFREQYEASWETAGGAAFYAFDTEHIQPVSYNSSDVILLGVDFNVDPMAWVLAHSPDGKSLHVFHELFLRDSNTPSALAELQRRFPDHQGGWHLFGDATGDKRSTNASASDYAIMLNPPWREIFRFQPFIPKANPSRDDRLASCNALFCNAAGDKSRFRIDHSCQRLINDLATRGFDKDGKLAPGKSGEEVGHLTDSLGYVIHSKWPSTLLQGGKGKVIIIKDVV